MIQTASAAPTAKQDKITLFDGLNIAALMIWFFTAFMTWAKAEELTTYSEEQSYERENVSYQRTDFKMNKGGEVSAIHAFWYEYYTPSGEYDYSEDTFGDRQYIGPGLGTFVTWVLAAICYFLAFAIGRALDEKITWRRMTAWIIFIAIPLLLTYSKWEFLYWISH